MEKNEIDISLVDRTSANVLRECFDLVGGTSCDNYYTLFDIADGRIGIDGQWVPHLSDVLLEKADSSQHAVQVVKATVKGLVHIIATAIIIIEIENSYLEIVDIVVNEKYHGKGIGKAMMQFVETYAKENKITRIGLSSSINNTNAHQFFHDCGYDKIAYEFLKNV